MFVSFLALCLIKSITEKQNKAKPGYQFDEAEFRL